eukprot:TRINITY_DN63978_c0_g1_i1.p1 TRINITY_DN63978_c0_g1~~TRINITY_DN63978_c0_g1_i1.p1  ORF type:complete len:253 (-),score=7.84 TRINITY_DN63978_c0_g1_i1:98-769(-)
MGPPPNELWTTTMNKPPKYSFGLRHGVTQENVGPGPYTTADPNRDTNCKYSRDPAFSFGSCLSARRPISAPGPGQYQSKVRSGAPSHGFGSAPRGGSGYCTSSPEPTFSPGPAAYAPNFEATRKKASQYSMGITGSTTRSSTPGPADYRPRQVPTKAAPPRWGSAPGARRRPSSAGAPGPSAYRRSCDVGAGPKFTMGRPLKAWPAAPEGARKIGAPMTQFGY